MSGTETYVRTDSARLLVGDLIVVHQWGTGDPGDPSSQNADLPDLPCTGHMVLHSPDAPTEWHCIRFLPAGWVHDPDEGDSAIGLLESDHVELVARASTTPTTPGAHATHATHATAGSAA